MVGNSGWASNQALGFSGNRNLLLNMINWLSSDEDLISIRPKEPEDRRITLTRQQFRMVQSVSQFILPLIVIVDRRDGLVEDGDNREAVTMRFRGLLVAVVLLAALGVGLYFSNKQKAAEAAKPPSDTPPKILALTEGDITKVALKKKGADETVLEKANGKWQITAPKPYPADQDPANQLVTAAANVSSDRVVEDKASNLSAYGLNAPSLEVDITGKGGKVSKLKFGDDTPTNSGSYAMLEGDPRVFTVASYVKTGLDKSVNDLRDKRLLTFDQDKLSRVELIAKKQDIEFGRDKDQWQIVKPKPLRADGLQVDEMLRKLKDAKMDLTLSDDDAKKAAAAFASGTPVATVKLTDPSGTQQIEIRKSAGAGNKTDDYYAKSSIVAGVFKATPDLGMGVDKALDDFRNKKLFDFGFNDPSKIEMHANGKFLWLPERRRRLVLERQEDGQHQRASPSRQIARPFRQ